MPDSTFPPNLSGSASGLTAEHNLIVVVRAPNQETQDFRVECPPTWTVLRLKEHLQQTYQGNPIPGDQKLIYSGQLLDDNAVLREVLRQDESCLQHTVHLVCRPPQDEASSSRSKASSGVQAQQESSRVLRNTGVAPDGTNELRYRGPMIQYEMASPRPDVYSAHVLALQSMYAQYYQQLVAQQQAILLGSSPATSIQYSFNPHVFQSGNQQQQLLAQVAAAAGLSQAQHASNNNNVNDNIAAGVQQQPHPQAAVNNNNVNINNNDVNNRANEEDAHAGAWGNANRDWLDVMYVAIRAAVFATFVYFYSSLERFVLVTGLGMLLYLYQQGLLGLPNVAPQAAPQVAPAVPQAPPPPNQPGAAVPPAERNNAHVDDANRAAAAATAQQREDIERLQAAMDGDNPRAMAGEGPPIVPRSNGAPPQSPIAAAINLLRAFLVSLIPDNNHQ